MPENTLARAFKQRVANQTVLVRRKFLDENGVELECHGTGVIIGFNEDCVHIATAGHVLDGFGEGKSRWAVQRVELDNEGTPIEFRQHFGDDDLSTAVPTVLCTEYLRDCDIGLMIVENRADGPPGTMLIDPSQHTQLKVIPTTGYLQTGGKVAWAGYPGFVADMTDRFHLCYFEGAVSAVLSEPPVYLVDGHTSPGVSGGPMWILQDDGEPIITAVCIHYAYPQEPTPGLVGFCPLQVLLRFVETMHAQTPS
jgi:hypothetical protein